MDQREKQREVKVLQSILNMYRITAVSIASPMKGYRNSCFRVHDSEGQVYNLMLYKPEDDIVAKIKNGNRLGVYLWEKGLPVRCPVSSGSRSIVQATVQDKKYYACLYNFLPGSTVPWEGFASKHIKLTGGMMGTMHKKLRHVEQKGLPDALTELQELHQRMKTYFERSDVRRAMAAKLKLRLRLAKMLEYYNLFIELKQEPKQAIHLDFVRGNILFDTKQSLIVSGIIDFEKAAWGPRILDIARTLAFLLVDCKYQRSAKIQQYFLRNGYQKRGENPLPDVQYLAQLIDFFWLHDFYKFLRHNPFEFLYMNEHYTRTEKILLERCILATNKIYYE
ncbi:MAG: phosphotransferase enzyme family protein, partial [Candidatus Dojkabacteria bacterium]